MVMSKTKVPSDPAARAVDTPAGSGTDAVSEFLAKVESINPPRSGLRGRLVFALDATMSRQPTWDRACQLQAEMFREAGRIGDLDVQLVYFRGMIECKASRWASDAERLGAMMSRIDCRGGHTQIGRVLSHAVAETRRERIRALVYVGDAVEESIDALCAKAGELALLGVPIFAFQEGRDPVAETALKELARITSGAWCRFDPSAAGELAALLRAVAAFAAGGPKALADLSARDGGGARLLLQQLSSNPSR
jgi:hypothetical protein